MARRRHVVRRVVDEHLDDSRFDGVTRIAIDDFSYRKRHKYITVIVDHDTGRVICLERWHPSRNQGLCPANPHQHSRTWVPTSWRLPPSAMVPARWPDPQNPPGAVIRR